MTTFNEHGNAMLQQAHQLRRDVFDGKVASDAPANRDAAGRDLSIAITHLEDALTRYNSACYHLAGTWSRRDPDAS